MKDTEHLKWIHDRLSKFYKENHNVDFLIRFRKIIARFDIMEDMLKAPPYDKLSELHHSALMSSQAKVKTLEADMLLLIHAVNMQDDTYYCNQGLLGEHLEGLEDKYKYDWELMEKKLKEAGNE